MTRSVPNTFAALTSPQLLNLDADFSALMPASVLPCTATGTNTYALVPQVSTLTVTAYSDKEQYSFIAPSTSTGICTINISSVGVADLYMPDGATQASTNDIISGRIYVIAYVAGIPGFVIVSQLTPDHLLDLISPNQGAMLQRGAVGWTAIAAGSTNSIMTMVNSSLPGWASSPAVVPFTAKFASTLHSIPSAGATISIAHGLASQPNFTWMTVTALSGAGNGWNAGDIFQLGPTGINIQGSSDGLYTYADPTNIYVLQGSGGNLEFPNKATGGNFVITQQYWALTVSGWY